MCVICGPNSVGGQNQTLAPGQDRATGMWTGFGQSADRCVATQALQEGANRRSSGMAWRSELVYDSHHSHAQRKDPDSLSARGSHNVPIRRVLSAGLPPRHHSHGGTGPLWSQRASRALSASSGRQATHVCGARRTPSRSTGRTWQTGDRIQGGRQRT